MRGERRPGRDTKGQEQVSVAARGEKGAFEEGPGPDPGRAGAGLSWRDASEGGDVGNFELLKSWTKCRCSNMYIHSKYVVALRVGARMGSCDHCVVVRGKGKRLRCILLRKEGTPRRQA